MTDLLVEPSSTSQGRRVVGGLLRSREISVLAVLVALIVVTTTKSHGFLFSSTGWRDLLLTPSLLVILAVGQTVVIITRNVDLSVGSTLGLSAYLTGKLFVDHPGLPIVVVFAAAMAFGALLGLVNGVLVAWGKVPALVITLGTLYIYRGAFLSWAGSDRINASDLPSGFSTSAPGRCCRSRSSRSSQPWCWSWSATCCGPPGRGASSTPSAPTRTQPSSTASASAAGCSSPSSPRERWPGWPASCTSPATAPSAPAPAPASSCRRSARPSSAGSPSSAAAGPSGALRSAASSW